MIDDEHMPNYIIINFTFFSKQFVDELIWHQNTVKHQHDKMELLIRLNWNA